MANEIMTRILCFLIPISIQPDGVTLRYYKL